MSELYTYSDVVQFWECPRQWAYRREGWQPLVWSKGMLRGHLIHRGIAAGLLGLNVQQAMKDAAEDYRDGIATIRVPLTKELEEVPKALQEAQDLTARYLRMHGLEFQPLYVEERLVVPPGHIGGTPDAVVLHKDRVCILELKTGASPDMRALDHTGQPDYYAWVWGQLHPDRPISYVLIDVITTEGIFRIERPPRIKAGEYIGKAAQNFQLRRTKDALETPHYGFWCRYCPFLLACSMRDTGGDDQTVLSELCYQAKEGRP